MVIILTQNKAIVNFNSNSTIGTTKTEDGRYALLLDENYVIGIYDTIEIATEVVIWIAESIGEHKADENICITIPIIESEVADAEVDRSNASEQDTQEV